MSRIPAQNASLAALISVLSGHVPIRFLEAKCRHGEDVVRQSRDREGTTGVPAIWSSNNGKKFLENLRLQPGHYLVRV